MDSAQRKAAKKRRTTIGRGATDLVAHFPHNRPKKIKELMLEEHTSGSSRVYTVAGQVGSGSPIVEMGKEISDPADGMNYAIAVVNKDTGETIFRPARLLSFEAVYANNMDELLDKKRKREDYSASFDLASDQWADKRKSLTQQFAGTKKQRILEASERRQINNDTLDEMQKTAFASDSITLKSEVDMKDEEITMVKKAQSEILPKWEDAALPRDIYPLSSFVSDDEVSAMVEECREFWAKPDQELLLAGVPAVIINASKQAGKTNPMLVAYTLLAAMCATLTKLNKKGILSKKDYDALSIPEGPMTKMRALFLPNEFRDNRGGGIMNVNNSDKERLISHAVAIALTLSPSQTIPLTPWSKMLQILEVKLVKVLQALGCALINLPAMEAIKFQSIRAARLVSAPKDQMAGPRKFVRRKSGK